MGHPPSQLTGYVLRIHVDAVCDSVTDTMCQVAVEEHVKRVTPGFPKWVTLDRVRECVCV